MTRINIVNPKELTDQHLIAEYREIFMVGPALQRSLRSKNGVTGIPERYTLNKGHVKFFYNKGKYLCKRYEAIKEEMIRRGMKPDPMRLFPAFHYSDKFFNDWSPVEGDFDIIRERIAKKLSEKPKWYKYYGKSIDK